MKRLVLAILVVTVVAAAVFAILNRPGAEATPPGATITVNTWLDENVRDDKLSLREAMMLATGDLLFTLLSEEECAQVSTVFWLEEPIHWCAGAAGNPPGADYADTIVFEEGLALDITLNSALPPLGTGDDTVDGSSASVAIHGGGTDAFDCFEITSDGNTIRLVGVMECKTAVWIHGGKNNAIEPPYIWSSATGVSITGSGTSGNSVMRVLVQGNGRNIRISGGAHHNIIESNRIVNSTESDGVSIWGSGTNSNEVKGNWIGTNSLGEPQPNKVWGVGIGDGAQGNLIGGTSPDEGNVIAFNTEAGVFVQEGALYNTIRGNSIYSNGGKGIELASGGNAELAPPTVDSVGSVFGTACATCTIDVYSDEEDEGRVYEGSTTADGDGNWSFSGTPGGPNITATATDSDGNTSEFSEPLEPPWPAPSPTPSPTPEGDSDGDTVPDDVEEALGSDWNDPDSTPEHAAMPGTCSDGVDNDGDGLIDAEDDGCAVAPTRTLVWGPGWHNVTWTGASTPEEAFACAAGNYAAAYRLVGGGWERHFPDRPDLSNMTDLAQYDAFLILVTGDVTCEMPLVATPGTERTLDWGVGWQNDGWTGADGTAPQDAFACADGSYAAGYRLVGGGWERYFPDRPDISNMGPLDEYDAFLILVTAPVSCTMAISPR
ncbi:MAG: right-handed parallel beta-helix repeat-containing protein [Dehalococcoidia bacterium]|nr:MAG: right-handed parallel beta-helix repeat-containing protein [Dehalococcoidia bacterium]